RAGVAAVNAARSVVLSGDAGVVGAMGEVWRGRGRKVRRLDVSHAFHSPLMDPMLDAFAEVLGQVEFRRPVVGMTVPVAEVCSAQYWVRQVREPVRFADMLTELSAGGVTRFVEVGPDGVLTGLGSGVVDGVFVAAQRKGRPEVHTALTALSTLYTHGVPVEWSAVVGRGSAVELPTYAFQRERYWPRARSVAGDVRGAGLVSVGHPLLGAAVELAGGEGVVFTSRLSLASQDWLADHAVRGVVVVPGTAFVELLVRAGDEVGCGVVEDLVLERPLVLPEHGAVQVQVVVEALTESGRRAVSVYSRPEETAGEAAWTQHAGGTLTAAGVAVPVWQDAAWPPAGAVPVPVDDLYDGLAEAGYGYGPTFRGLRAVWRRGEEVFAEVRLPEGAVELAGEFGGHPALFDAALHAAVFLPGDVEGGLPFSWSGVSLHASGARSLRVRLSVTGDGALCLDAADDTGAPVLSVDSLTLRSVRAELLESGAEQHSLFSVEWVLKPVVPAQSGGSSPRCVVAGAGGQDLAAMLGVPWHLELSECPRADLVLLPAGVSVTGDVAAVRSEVCRVLELAQEWLADDERDGARLVVVTRNAVSTGTGDRVSDVSGAGVQGLVRSARSEHPGRFGLVDVDGSTESWRCLPAVLSSTADDEGDFELAVRAGQAYSPRLTSVSAGEVSDLSAEARPVNPEGTVLITGGTGTLGGVVARDWVERHGVRRLLLVSRQGIAAPGARELAEELTGLGAEARVVACDVSDLAALTAVLDAIPDEHPLTAVVHTAGVVDDGMVTSLTPERVDAVMRPKADAAWYLHEATAGLDLAAFVLFSSTSGVLGAAGQAGYAAANSVLDAIAQQRAARGEAAVSVAWGMWAPTSALTGQLSQTDRRRISATGVVPLTAEEGVALLDRAVRSGRSFVAGMRWDPAGVRAGQPLSGLLRGLVRGPVRRRSLAVVRDGEAAGAALRQRLAGLSAADAHAVLAQVVTTHTATVLGHATPESVQATSAFQELGFDSMTAVDLRNRLNTVTGLRLPATLVFDYPTPAAVADHLRSELRPDIPAAEPSEDADIRLGETLATIPVSRLRKAGLLDLLLRLAGEDGEAAQTTTSGDEVSIDELDGESLLRLAAENTTN
uniref:type I polyketide synthase n=1 Tax=Streptomyces sp. 4F14 TaxID=3394380 RepID=UPI003A873CFD